MTGEHSARRAKLWGKEYTTGHRQAARISSGLSWQQRGAKRKQGEGREKRVDRGRDEVYSLPTA